MARTGEVVCAAPAVGLVEVCVLYRWATWLSVVILAVCVVGTAVAAPPDPGPADIGRSERVEDLGEADEGPPDRVPAEDVEPQSEALPTAVVIGSDPSPGEPASNAEDAAPAQASPAPPADSATVAPESNAGEPAATENTGSGVADGNGRYREGPGTAATLVYRAVSLLGIFAFIAIGWVLSEKRGEVKWRPVLWGVGLQLAFGLIVLGLGGSEYIYSAVNYLVGALLSFSDKGSAFLFASFIPHQVDTIAGPDTYAPVTYGMSTNDVENWAPGNKNIAFAVLPTIIFFSALMSLLYFLGLMNPIVRGIAWVMMRTLGTSGSESLSAAGNIFVGQTEAPLLVKPFVPTMTRSELMAVMTGGFATVAGGVLGVYVMLLQDALPSIAGHLVVASILSAPAALAMAKVMVPETEQSETAGDVRTEFENPSTNFIEAAANGATDGMKLVLNVAAMLIAIVALVAMVNWLVSWVPVGRCGDFWQVGYICGLDAAGRPVPADPIGLSDILGVAFLPAAILMGVPFEDWFVVGQLLGEKIVLTELIAYKSLAGLVSGDQAVLSQRGAVIASYGLCGFANFASIGIQLGGIGGLAPKRMGELATLGFRAMIGGALAACMTGAVAGVFL